MVRVVFTQNLQRHVASPECRVVGQTVNDVLAEVFRQNTRLRDYVVDEHGALRQHMTVFIDGSMIQDRQRLSDVVTDQSEVYVMQALSGG